jgi:putative hemolysin
MDTVDWWKLSLLLLCLLFSGFFSASETAFIALRRARLMHLHEIGRPGAGRVTQLLKRPEKLLATVLLGNNLVNTAAAVLATALSISLIENDTIALLASTLGVTIILLVFSETLPKTIAWNRPEAIAFAVSGPLTIVGWTLSPAIRILQEATTLASKTLGIAKASPLVTEDEIRTMIAVSAKTGAVEASEAQLLEKVFRFGDQRVREIMTPRPEIIWVEHSMTVKSFLSLYADHAHTRFPVYQDTLENVVGVLSIKEVMMALSHGKFQPKANINSLLRPAYFVPETKTVGSTFSEMQKGGYGIVMTVNEFGGIAGLVTLKQLLEVIVGQVSEEGVPAPEVYATLTKNTFRVDAGANIFEINDELDVHIPHGDYQTVAGFILNQLGRIPAVGDIIEYQNMQITVMQMDGVRIDQVELYFDPSSHHEVPE